MKRLIFYSIIALLGLSCTKEKENPYGAGNGRISFWSQIGNEGAISITINGTTKELTHYWGPSGALCDEAETAAFILPAGSHSFAAVSTSGSRWTGSVSVFEGDCVTKELTIGSPSSAGFSNQGIITIKSRNVRIGVWDGATIDGDKMSLVFNGRTIVSNLTIDGTKRYYTFTNIPQDSWIGVIAVSEGSIPPCTPDIEVYDGFTTQHFEIRSYVSGTSGAYVFKIQL